MKKLIEWRKAKTLNKSQAAKLIGVNRSTYGRWEQGQKVHIENIKHLSKITGIPKRQIRPDIY